MTPDEYETNSHGTFLTKHRIMAIIMEREEEKEEEMMMMM
jgi:hypothetical protein